MKCPVDYGIIIPALASRWSGNHVTDGVATKPISLGVNSAAN